MDIPSVFSIIFNVACAISLFLGIYILYLNPNSKTNRLFFAVTIALDFWAFGFSMAVSAHELSTVLFWRRFAAVGFGSFFCVLLHFFIVYTGKEHLIYKRWKKALLYIPVIITYLGFTYFPNLNPSQYNMISTTYGWTNVAVNNWWDWFFTAYYILYSIAGYYLVWQWGRKSKNLRKKKQSYFILVSFFFTMIFGSLTDILGNMFFLEKIPQLAPILMVFPTCVVYYTIKKFGLFNPRHVVEEAILLTDQIRSKIVIYMSYAFLVGGILNFVSQYLLFDDADLKPVLVSSGILALIGVIFYAIDRWVRNTAIKDVLNAITFAVIIPVITLRFIDFASVTIWAFPFILLIITLMFGRSIIQITLTISIILTQIIVWMQKPVTTLTIDSVDHVVRIGLFGIAIWFSFFVKRIYLSKLSESTSQINAQKLITEISSDFVSVSESNLDDKINHTLAKLCSYLAADNLYVYIFDNNSDNFNQKYRYSNDARKTATTMPEVIISSSCSAVSQQLQGGNTIALSDITDAAEDISNELHLLINSQEKSLIAIPIIIHNDFLGFFGMDADRQSKKWHESQISFFKIISNILADAFEKVTKEKEINFMAYYDHLTKLPNRTLFKDRVTQAINLAGRTNKMLSVMFLDLDAFKAVNDSIGHDGGDNLLVYVSKNLSSLLRKSDAISRFGGDEFLIMLNNLNSTADLTKIAEKILSIFNKPFNLNGQEFFVTASAGVSVYPYDGEDAEALIKNADIAMYKAKEQGKNKYLFCTADMKNDILLRMRLSNSLYRALDRDEFILHYQPQVCTDTKKIIGAEALLRWSHPELGLIPPNSFIPLAEQTGLIGPIGEWVLRTACKQCKAWQLSGLPAIRMAVNVSIIQLRNPDFISQIKSVLLDTQLETEYLELEITESIAVNESNFILQVLHDIKDLGISISIDDFGTEYSSLSRLTSMPIDRIKMDMQFVRGINKSDKDKAIAKGIIGLAHNLGLKVIAEGVETELQLNFLSDKNCDEIQGYYFYRPIKSDDFENILRETKTGDGTLSR